MTSKGLIIRELDEYIEGLLLEIEQLAKEVSWYKAQLEGLEAMYQEFGLNSPDSYSVAQLSSIAKAIENAL